MGKKPRSFLEITNHGKPLKSQNEGEDASLEYNVLHETPLKGGEDKMFEEAYSPEKISNSFLNENISIDFINKIDSDSREISKNNKNLEQKIKAELSGINIFKKGGHLLKTITSKEYREQTADELINDQLQTSANFRDSIKTIYTKLHNELRKNVDNLDMLESKYFSFIEEREITKKSLKKIREDYTFLK